MGLGTSLGHRGVCLKVQGEANVGQTETNVPCGFRGPNKTSPKTVSKVNATMDAPTVEAAARDRNNLVRALFSLWSMLGDCLGTVVVCVAALLTFSITIIQTETAAGSQLRYWILAVLILCYGTLMAVGVRAFR